jgi:hypothetical protein
MSTSPGFKESADDFLGNYNGRSRGMSTKESRMSSVANLIDETLSMQDPLSNMQHCETCSDEEDEDLGELKDQVNPNDIKMSFKPT